MKEISNYYSVTIDDLLSGEKLLSIAEKENKANIRDICNLLFGIVDICSFLLIFLPLYPNRIDGFVYSVNLISYAQIASVQRLVYWIFFLLLIVIGILKIVFTKLGMEGSHKFTTGISMLLSILIVLFLSIAREAYAITVIFMLLVIKGILLLKYSKVSS